MGAIFASGIDIMNQLVRVRELVHVVIDQTTSLMPSPSCNTATVTVTTTVTLLSAMPHDHRPVSTGCGYFM